MHGTTRSLTGLAALFAILLSGATAHAALILDPPQPIVGVVTVQPIVVSDDDGSNTATFFGNLLQQSTIEGLIDDIWAQAGLDIQFLAPNFWNNTFANQGAPGLMSPRPNGDLNSVVTAGDTAGVGSPNPNVIDLYLVNIAAGFGALSANSAAGLAFVGGSGITQYVGANLLTFPAGLETIASVVGHEIGHNLGLFHLVEAENLMQSSGSPSQGERLNPAQIATVTNSPLVSAIPLPAAVWLLGSGAVALVAVRRSPR